MRLRTDIFVAALTRRVFASGDFAAIERKGADSAGAIYLRQRFRDGTQTVLAPAPQSFFEEDGQADDRLFEIRLARAEGAAADAFLAAEARFDPDLWVVEIEREDLGDLVTLAKDKPSR